MIFDLSEVLFFGFLGFADRLSQELGIVTSNQVLYDNPALHEYFRGSISETTMWSRFIEQYGWKTNVDRLRTMIRQHFDIVPGTFEIVIELRAAKHPIGVLSVHGREWIAHLEEKYHFERYFHRTSYSFQNGSVKPEPRAFETVLKSFGAEAKECFFIDDYDVNTKAAAKLGFQTHTFTTAENLRADLRKKKILS